MSGKSARPLALVAAVLLSSGCERMPQEGRPQAEEGWQFEAEPMIIAGSLDASPELSFHQITAASRLRDGRVVVVDGGLRSRLTILTSDGEFLATIGRNGEGPGEFGWVTSVQAGANDSLFVFDAGQQRLTVFSPDGSALRTASYRPVGGEMLGSVTHLGGQTWLGRGLDSPLQGPTYQIVQDTIVFGLLDARLEHLELLAELPSLMSTTTPIGGSVGFGVPAFTPIAIHATWGRCIFVSTADTSSIQVYSADGQYLRSFEGPGTLRPVSQEDLETFIQYRLRGTPEDRRQVWGQALRDAAHPENLPYYHQMLTDQWGYLWLQEYSPPIGVGDHWYVLTPSGRVAGDVVLPASIRVFAIDEYGLLGVVKGELDDEMIVVLRMTSRPQEALEGVRECQPRWE